MLTGTVKWFNSQKGYGFIQPESGERDVFVHVTALEAAGISTLNDGQSVTFELQTDRRTNRQSAVNITLN